MEKFADQLVCLRYKLVTPEKIIGGSIFPLYEIDKVNRVLKVGVSPSLSYILSDTDRNFTEFMIHDHNKLKGKYTKTLYRILCQWKNAGHTQWFDIEELKEVFGADNYDIKNFIRELKKAIDELSRKGSFKNLKMDFQKDSHKQGSPVKAVKFSFKKSAYAPVIG